MAWADTQGSGNPLMTPNGGTLALIAAAVGSAIVSVVVVALATDPFME